MADLDRREFLRYSADVAGRAVAGFAALGTITSCSSGQAAPDRPTASRGDGGYGSLRDAGPELALPEGFSYRVIGVEGSMMSDGHPTPERHDGQAAFPLPNGNIRLIRNHEVENSPGVDVAMGDPATAYDPGAGGGTVSLEVHPETREVIRDFVSLNGTWRNCAGGRTPWGSWLSCEEAFFGPESGFGEFHGYVFDVPAAAEQPVTPEPLIALGRFVHEAVAVDPRSGIVYQTEDHFRAGFYRFIPNRPYQPGDPGDLRAGGRLQMLAIRGRDNYDTATGQRTGVTLPVAWVDIAETNPLGGPSDFGVVFEQGFAQGAARFSRLEGCFYADGNVYLIATNGGNAELGQVWQYRPTGPDEGGLTLIYETRNRRTLNRPDNICVSPKGAIILCEDANVNRHYVRGLTPEGRVFDIAANVLNTSEVTGPTFSPDGRTLFFNAQGVREKGELGMTFAVWGPWERGAV